MDTNLLIVVGLNALGTCRNQYLPPTPYLLGGHLNIRVMMTTSLVIKGGIEFLIHVTTGFMSVSEGIGHAVDRTTLLDLTRSA
jgi:hypothetical protein